MWLAASGFSHMDGVKWSKSYTTYTAVAETRFTSDRILLATDDSFNLELHHMDVITASLKGDLKEANHTEQPQGYERGNQADSSQIICALNSTIS